MFAANGGEWELPSRSVYPTTIRPITRERGHARCMVLPVLESRSTPLATTTPITRAIHIETLR